MGSVLAYFCASTDNQDPNTQIVGSHQAITVLNGYGKFATKRNRVCRAIS